MKLSEHFKLSEFIASETADKLGIDNSIEVGSDFYVVENLKSLCGWTLEPIRAKIGCPVRISSGYRCARLNEAVNGSDTSDHLCGLAADIYFEHFKDRWYEVVILLACTPWIPFDQLIIYDTFLHVGIGRRMRRQILDYRNK